MHTVGGHRPEHRHHRDREPGHRRHIASGSQLKPQRADEGELGLHGSSAIVGLSGGIARGARRRDPPRLADTRFPAPAENDLSDSSRPRGLLGIRLKLSDVTRQRLRHAVRVAGYLAVVCVIVIATYVVFVGIRRTQTVTLPEPGGPHPVGRLRFDWTDTNRVDPYSPTTGLPRALSVWLWYPAERGRGGLRSTYAPGPWSGLGFTGATALLRGPLTNVRPNSSDNPAAATGRFPIVVLQPGMGLAAPEFATLAEGIASEGYIVAGITPTYSANLTVLDGHAIASTPQGKPSDLGARDPAALDEAGRLVGTWADDARFAVGRVRGLDHDGTLAGHVDTGPVSYVGHSFGGASALQACDDDPTCAGAADIDGEQFGPVSQTGSRHPFLILGSENSCVLGDCDAGNAHDRAELAASQRFLQTSSGPAYRYSILGTEHFNFSDIAVWYIAPPLRQLFPLGPIDGNRGLVIAEAVVVAFLARIHAAGPGDLGTLTNRYPEVRRLG